VAQGGLAKAEQTTVEYGDGVLRIEASAENQILGSSGSIEVTVQLPGGSRIEAKAARAEFRAVGRFGDVTFEGSHGSIKLDEAASVRLTTLAGDVSVGRLNGPAEISIGKGHPDLISLDAASANSAAAQPTCTPPSASGGRHPPGIAVRLDAHTPTCRVRDHLQAPGTPEQSDRTVRVRARSNGGDIIARRA
jgi:hypothetical protein